MSSSDTCEKITATPKALIDYLLENRFKENAAETAQFLLQAMDQLPDLEKISAELLNQVEDEDSELPADEGLGEIQKLPSPTNGEDTTEISISATTPRTKLTLCAHENGIIFTSPKDEKIVLNPDAVSHIVFFPKREDCLKKPKRTKDGQHIVIPGSQVLIILKSCETVKFRNKKLTQICLQLPQHFSERVELSDTPPPSEEQLLHACIEHFEEKIVETFTSSLQLKNRLYRVYNPKFHNIKQISSYAFQSDDGGANKSIMQGQMPYLKCYHGVNDGVIYPMEEGLLFFKPPLFIHRSTLHSIAVGRGGGSRFVDLHATLDECDGNNAEIEFTNIDREEMAVLNSYIHDTLVKAMAKDAEEDENDDSPTEHVIEDEGVSGSDDNAAVSSSRKRSRRQAATEARKATKFELEKGSTHDHEEGDDSGDDEDGDGDYGMVEKNDEEESEDDDEEFDDSGSASDVTVSEDNADDDEDDE